MISPDIDITSDNACSQEPTTLPQVVTTAPLPSIKVDLDDAVSFARAEKAPATRRAYHSDFELFRAWCEGKDVLALPAWPETVAAFLAAEAKRGVKASTIGRRVAAIRYAHKLAGHEPPTNAESVKATVRGIRRSIGTAKARKTPILAETMRTMAWGTVNEAAAGYVRAREGGQIDRAAIFDIDTFAVGRNC